MAIHSTLKSLFPKYNMEYHQSSVTITEQNSGAKVKCLFWENSDFHFVDTEIVRQLTGFFEKSNSPEIFRWDCDGIVIFEENGKKYIFLTELKSSFDTSHLYHAKDQIISSYIKINMILHLLPNYNNKDYIFKAFIVCSPPDHNFMRDLHKELMFKRGSRFKTEAEFSDELYFDANVKLKAIECEKLRGLNLGSNCLFNEMEFYYIKVPLGDDTIKVDVNKYI